MLNYQRVNDHEVERGTPGGIGILYPLIHSGVIVKGAVKNGLSIFWCPIPVWGGEMAEPLRFT